MRIKHKTPVVETMKIVLDASDKYIKDKNGSAEGIGEYIEQKFGLTPQYTYILRHYGDVLRYLRRFDKAYAEKWTIRKIIAFIKMYEDIEFIKMVDETVQKYENESPDVMDQKMIKLEDEYFIIFCKKKRITMTKKRE